MEGLICYIPPEAVDDLLSFIAKNSAKGSTIIFDYGPKSIVDGTCESGAGKNIRMFLAKVGEPLQFGIDTGQIEEFLTSRGFSRVQNSTSEDYRRLYFYGPNKDRATSSLMSFVHAHVR